MDEFSGLYPARVVNNADPLGRQRLRVQIPQLLGYAAAPWADRGGAAASALPKVGDTINISFIGGDASKPVWWGSVEPDVTDQLGALSTLNHAAWTSDIAASSASDRTYTRLFASNVTDNARAYKTLDSDPGTAWSNITWGTQDTWTGDNYYGNPTTSFIRQDGASYRLDVPVSGIYSYTAVLSTVGIDAGQLYGMRAIWQQDAGNTNNYVVAQAGPVVSSLFFESILSLSFLVDQSTVSSVRIQIRTPSGGATVQRDNMLLSTGVATRSQVQCVLVKRNDY